VAKIKLDAALFERIKKIADQAGYGSPDEFIVHVLEKDLSMIESVSSDEEVTDRLRGLGYLE
jgi:hypothetical protein